MTSAQCSSRMHHAPSTSSSSHMRVSFSSHHHHLTQSSSSLQRTSQRHTAESQITTLALQELQRAVQQGLLGQHVLLVVELAAGEGTLSAPVQLPQCPVLRLDEAHIVQVHVVLRVRRSGRALACCGLVRGCQGGCLLEEGGALGWAEGCGGLDELVEVGAGFYASEEESVQRDDYFNTWGRERVGLGKQFRQTTYQ
jgi:hypothetical protein